ncbi:MAG: diacylglycerol kinase family lipid kinase [Candidatus Sericytochromatia bacterium]|nr:diacylglycerol kinase family lipid kinase [Candidatus Sericytochromatia bacterium]
MRAILITNPAAGSPRPDCSSDALQWRLETLGWDVWPATCPAPGEEPSSFKELLQAADMAVIAGGDGTIRQVVSHVVGTQTRLAILPCGTGNDLARSLGLPLDPLEAIEVANAGVPRAIDVGVVNGVYFMNVVSLGISASVSRNLAQETKRQFGPWAYRLAALRELSRRTQLTIGVTFDGHTRRHHAYQVSIANGESFGGGWRVSDSASLDDHMLDVVVIGPMTLRDRWARLLTPEGGLAGNFASHAYRTKTCRIDSGEVMVLNVDGDPISLAPPLTIAVIPGALQVMVPVTAAATQAA